MKTIRVMQMAILKKGRPPSGNLRELENGGRLH